MPAPPGHNGGRKTASGLTTRKTPGDKTVRTYLECYPCLVHQAVDAIQRVVDDPETQTAVLRRALDILSEAAPSDSPPLISSKIHRALRSAMGDADPYREIKDQSNAFALRLYPQFQERVRASDDPLGAALRLAIAGNVIDYGAKRHVSEEAMSATIENALDAPLDAARVREFREAVEAADSILYLADNAGEIVFDRLLLEYLPLRKITLAVRGAPIINDVTLDDARTAGLTDMLRVLDNGSDVPGTALSECSPEFQKAFAEADLVIAKGQGNLETLFESSRRICFLLLCKCPLVAEMLGCGVGDMVIRCAAP